MTAEMRLNDVTDRTFRYDAFLSYAHEDEAVVAWLQRVLERSWVPGKRRRAIFRDKNRLDAGPLTERLRIALADSRYLVVCCSKSAAASKWVNQEIEDFARLRNDDRSQAVRAILACRVDRSEPSVVPPALRSICLELGDELYVPDISTSQPAQSGRDRRRVKSEAFALLAPLVGLPDRDSVYARIRKRQLFFALTSSLVFVAGALTLGWTRTDSYQISAVASAARSILPAAQYFAVDDYLETLATLRPDQALQQARAIVDEGDRALALVSVGRGLATAGQFDLARSATTESSRLAADIEDPYARATVLLPIAESWFRLSELSSLEAARQNSLSAALEIEHPLLRGQVLCELLRSALRRGATAHAHSAALALIDAARMDQGDQVRGLGCAAAAVEADDGPDDRILEEALAASNAIAAVRQRADALADVAEVFVDSGSRRRSERVAQQAFEAALHLTGTIRSFILVTRILPVLESANLTRLLEHGTRVALEDALGETNPDSRARAIAAVLRWVVKVTPMADALGLAQAARTAAEAIPDPGRRVDVLASTAHDIAKARIPFANTFAREALASIATHNDDRGRSVAYAQVAAAFTELGDLRSARLAADQCIDSTDRLSAYEGILKRRVTNGIVPAIGELQHPKPSESEAMNQRVPWDAR